MSRTGRKQSGWLWMTTTTPTSVGKIVSTTLTTEIVAGTRITRWTGELRQTLRCLLVDYCAKGPSYGLFIYWISVPLLSQRPQSSLQFTVVAKCHNVKGLLEVQEMSGKSMFQGLMQKPTNTNPAAAAEDYTVLSLPDSNRASLIINSSCISQNYSLNGQTRWTRIVISRFCWIVLKKGRIQIKEIHSEYKLFTPPIVLDPSWACTGVFAVLSFPLEQPIIHLK